ncbi:DinB family protein [Croceitalea sp. P059]|uniref:DinB family protein n=1 Tax=Croceitalea sp. P059 TaxID=3075601 RepID=UPI002887ADB8|nr:DinB family protein [Croceitalea sp. P059]MDT0538503.1 DinB family protein [Croceitalea sp. P059]
MIRLIIVPLLFVISTLQSQTMDVPYHQIPDYPKDYTTGNVVARMIDGLGYRFYWATEGLTTSDLTYKPSENGRTMLETLQHIYGMSEMILESPKGEPSIRPKDFSNYSFEELRTKTLHNLHAASNLVKGKTADEVSSFKVTFQRGEKQTDFPYWNMLNGMLSDCIYHTGQLVLMRRANGNPQNPNVNVFMGKTREN